MSTTSVGAAPRDDGLLRSIGPFGLASNVFNNVVGAGIFVLPAALARDIGTAAPFAYLGCMVAMVGVVICFAAAGSRAPTSGGPYGFVDAAFGSLAGFVTGVLVWSGAVLASAGIAAAIADSLGAVAPAMATPAGRTSTIILLFAAFAAVNIAGVSRGASLAGAMTLIKLAPLAVLLGVGAFHVKVANLLPSAAEPASFGRAMILAAFAFQGMEGALGVSGEVRRPERNVPLGLMGAMTAIAFLYVAIQLVVQGVLGPALASSKAPLADALRGVSPVLSGLLAAGATLSMLGYLAGDTLSAPRVLFAFGRDGLLPKGLGALHPRTHAPYVAILAHVSVGALLAVSGSFAELAILSSLATVTVYVASCGAAVLLQRRGVALAGQPMTLRALPVAAFVGVVGMGWIAIHATWAEGLALCGVIAASALWFGASKLRRPGRA